MEPLVTAEGHLIALIKPQFEAEKNYMNRCKGIIRDPRVQGTIRDDILQFAKENLPSMELVGTIESPILGAEGNREFLFGLRKKSI
jgi:23S rRNA (cytidine1920-2'-O)/16S rRNA (cytidine1409-2'-O)-methyltransferase